MTWKAWLAFAVGIAIGFVAAISTQGMIDTYVRSTAKRTASECFALSRALEQYRTENGHYPPLDGNIAHLETYLVPKYITHVPTRSLSSGEPILVVLRGDRPAVVALGR